MQPLRILIAEDSPADAELILRELRRSGFEPEWERVDTESDYLERLHSGVEIVLSDYEMPQFSGPRALELLRESGLDIPFIIISGTIGEDIAVEVMKLGASDYLLKDRLARLGLAVSHALDQARLRAERKNAEASLLVSQTTMAAAQQIAHFGSWEMEMTNPDGIDANGLHWSDEMFRIAGYEPGAVEVTNELFFSLVHPDDHAAIRQAVAAAIREHGQYSIVHRMRRPDGVERIVRETGQIFYDEKSGLPVKMIGTAHDITEQRKVDEHLKLLETCVARLNDIVVITEAEPRDEPGPAIRFVNDAFILRTGYTRAEVIGRSPRFLQGPKTCGTELKRIRDAMQHWMPVRAELINYTKSGEEFWIELDIVPVANADGTFTHWVGVARDSTARKKAEEAMKESEARMRILVQASNIGLWEWNLATNEVFFSPEWKSQLGYTDSELPNRYEEWETRIHPEDRATTLGAVKDYLEGRRPDYEIEFRLRHKSGSWRWILTRAKMTTDAAGKPSQIMGCQIDITERKRSGERFRRLVESNAQGVLFWNKNGSITDANDAFLNLTGYSREELDAGRMNWIAMTPPQYEHMDRHCLEEIAARGVCAPYEKEYLRKDGSRVPVIIAAAVFDDNPMEGVCFTVDLTERKKLEQQFLRAQRMESIGTLAAGIAHDLNNILAPIMMSVPMLRRELPAAEREGIIATIEMSAERGAQIVKQVLTFGRGVEGERRPVKVDGLIGEIVKIIHGTFPKDITLEQRIAPGLWPVMGDATQIHQILLNLCINARDAMPEGGGTAAVRPQP